MTYRSNANPMFRSKFSEDIFNQKYKHEGAETWEELASTLVEDVCQEYLADDEKDALKRAITTLKFIPGGRYLYYAGRLNKYFNNCYLLRSEEDSREDWANLSWKAESCLTTGGGIGNDYSIYRAEGEPIRKTGGFASGPISKMNMINEIGRRVMQGGSRRSAIYASLNWKHKDAHKFLVAKDWKSMTIGNVKKSDGTPYTLWDAKQEDFNFPAPLDMTNISLNYDTEWLTNYWATGDVGETFRKNVAQALQTSEPGFSFNFFDKENETLRNACVTAETLVLTNTGYVPIVELIGNETVIWNGEAWATVTPYYTGFSEVYKVTFSDGTSLTCTDNHKFPIQGRGLVELNDISVGEKLTKFDMPYVYHGEEYVNAYSQGFYSGDGNTGYNFSWLYGTKYVCEPLLCGQIKAIDGKSGSNRKLWKHGPMLAKDWVPLDGNARSKLNWLAGLMDSDGTVLTYANGKSVQIGSINKEFLSNVRMMLTTLGVQAKVTQSGTEHMEFMPDGKGGAAEYLRQASYRLLINSTDLALLTSLGLFTARLDVSNNNPQRDARQFVKVVSIEPVGDADTYCFTEPTTNRGTFNGIVTGQCTEVTSEDDSDVCNLGSINIGRVDDINEFIELIELSTKFLICGTLRAQLPYDKVYATRLKNRRLGLGLMGLHEWLIKKGQRYEVTEELHRWLAAYKSVSDNHSAKFADKLHISRPVANRAIAPTGSIGILAGTTTGIEPIFAVAYKRRYLTNGTVWKYQYVVDSAAEEMIRLYDANPDDIESAMDLANDYERRMAFQADIQDYVDMSISSTINLPAWGSKQNNPDTVEPFAQTLAKYAHRLRGFTCYADGSRGGQPLTSVPYSEAVEKLGEVFEESIEANDICDITGKGGSCGV